MSPEPFKYAIALTGSIATGKSTVVKLLKAQGFEIIDADKIAHEVLDEEYQNIAKIFGTHLIKEKRVDRKALGKIVFSNKQKRDILEALLHPLIYNRIAEKSLLIDRKNKPYFVDIPLFFEGGRYNMIHNILLVYTTKEQQLKRLMDREGFTEEDALLRINSQIGIDEKRAKATYIIDNSGDLKQLRYEIEQMKEEILGAYR